MPHRSAAETAAGVAAPAPVDVDIDHVSKTFAGAHGPVAALASIHLEIARGSFVAIIGPSGCGKSTLLRIAAGLETPDQGAVFIRGEDPGHFRARGELGIVFQDPALLPWRSVRRNVALPLQVLGRRARDGEQKINKLIVAGVDGLRGRASGAALRRHAPARRNRPRTRHATIRASARRAVWRP
jgi:NitT/TauT family transport system ATP-binding protein